MYQTKISAISCHQMPRLAIDAGNRFIKIAAPGFRKVLPAYYSKANFRDSEAVEYQAGDRKDLTGERWLIGDDAKYREGAATFYSEKAEIMPLMVLGVLPQLNLTGTVNIANLRLCLPDVFGEAKKQLITALKGVHTINDNTYRIGSVEVLSEGAAAFPYLLSSGVFKYARNNGVLDIGGGNATGIILTPNGQPIWESQFTGLGTIELAKMVAQHRDLIGIEAKGLSPRLDLILDAIAGDGSYGVVRNISRAIDDCLPDFSTQLKKQLSTAWTNYLPTIGEIAIIGGSACLLNSWKSDRIKVVESGQMANCEGLLCG
ncbi:ParM/StbA family protein [Planktothricoides raciborskii]|uniref:ParM/StbA family protein n=1 Tax=Planktothricoides raciborskii GIHE-MW2 TaxID=2792601 RepID=A0AAU8JGQ4_9CYAN